MLICTYIVSLKRFHFISFYIFLKKEKLTCTVILGTVSIIDTEILSSLYYTDRRVVSHCILNTSNHRIFELNFEAKRAETVQSSSFNTVIPESVSNRSIFISFLLRHVATPAYSVNLLLLITFFYGYTLLSIALIKIS